jgi:hypothetical protein
MSDTALVPVSSIQGSSFFSELLQSTEHIFFQNRLTLLMTLGPMAIVGDSLGFLGEELSFLMAGIALIPCAERYARGNVCIKMYLQIFFTFLNSESHIPRSGFLICFIQTIFCDGAGCRTY